MMAARPAIAVGAGLAQRESKASRWQHDPLANRVENPHLWTGHLRRNGFIWRRCSRLWPWPVSGFANASTRALGLPTRGVIAARPSATVRQALREAVLGGCGICRANAGRSCRRPFAWVNLPRFCRGFTMRLLLVIAELAVLLASSVHADTRQNCAAAWQNMPTADRGDMTQREWSAKCLKPTYSVGEYGAPGYAIAICKDGHFSRRKKTPHRCSHHGGVAKYL
jgi:hypothetical protein